MRLLNLTPFPIRIGSAEAPEIPSSGVVMATSATPASHAELIAFEGLGEIRCEPAARFDQIKWPTDLDMDDAEATPAIVIPLAVVTALREMGKRAPTGGMVFSPGMLLTGEGGVKYAPHLVRHRDLEMTYRGR